MSAEFENLGILFRGRLNKIIAKLDSVSEVNRQVLNASSCWPAILSLSI